MDQFLCVVAKGKYIILLVPALIDFYIGIGVGFRYIQIKRIRKVNFWFIVIFSVMFILFCVISQCTHFKAWRKLILIFFGPKSLGGGEATPLVAGSRHTISFFKVLQKGLKPFFYFYRSSTNKNCRQRNLKLDFSSAKRTIIVNFNWFCTKINTRSQFIILENLWPRNSVQRFQYKFV